ncbi:MAG TPA: MATE family efflux transporter, partial [Polyangiales bacterium]|nr:MATE family efflux transporter [Polyangiales bacterium]
LGTVSCAMRAGQMTLELTRAEVLRRAWPIILANATVPLLSLVDTAVIGHTGSATDLGAVALGGLVFNFIHVGLNFLRMSTTGFVSQASGAGDAHEVRAVFMRSLCIAAVIGLVLLVLKQPVTALSMQLLHGSDSVESSARAYVGVRLWAAPAGLCTHVVRGVLIGLGHSRALLWLEGCLNGVNLALNLLFVAGLGWGATGVALGTAIAEWLGFVLALLLMRAALRELPEAKPWTWQGVFGASELRVLFQANADILVRTLLLLFGFAVFTDASAQFGDIVLAANHVLLQFISFCAFFLDGYANVAESLVGSALGAGQRRAFDLAVRRSSELAFGNAAVLALGLFGFGPLIIRALTDLPAVQAAAQAQLPLAALYIALSVAAFQLDGIFIGATRTRDMRNASIASCAVFVLAAHLLTAQLGNAGLWLAFLIFVIARALTLGAYYPGLRRSIPEL